MCYALDNITDCYYFGRMTQACLGSVDDVVAAFGGTSEMAATLDFTEPQIKMWKSRGRFSAQSWARIHAAAEQRGIRIDPELIGGFGAEQPTQAAE